MDKINVLNMLEGLGNVLINYDFNLIFVWNLSHSVNIYDFNANEIDLISFDWANEEPTRTGFHNSVQTYLNELNN